MHILFETASGYSLFNVKDFEDIGKNLTEVQKDILDLSKFGAHVQLVSFVPFQSASHALENINSISEGIVHPYLKSFLETNHTSKGKSKNTLLGVTDKTLATSIKQELGIDCSTDDLVQEITRGIRLHCDKLLKQLLQGHDLERAQLGLGHGYSRGKVCFNVNRSDNMIIQAIALCDQLDKDINLFSMRVREWYSWHFPELGKLIQDNQQYATLTAAIRSRQSLLSEDESAIIDKLVSIVQDTNLAQQILYSAKTSMGTDISEVDLMNIDRFAHKIISLSEYRKKLQDYLHSKMHMVAPNLAALVGDAIGARLISHAGSLTNLAKFPASTIQILGAEKALFRALKTRGKTPKYGLLFHASHIGKADTKNKGRISRYLANKCSIASRIDSFSDSPTDAFGEAMKNQVEQRVDFYNNGGIATLQTNEQVMKSVMDTLSTETKRKESDGGEKKKKKKKLAKE